MPKNKIKNDISGGYRVNWSFIHGSDRRYSVAPFADPDALERHLHKLMRQLRAATLARDRRKIEILSSLIQETQIKLNRLADGKAIIERTVNRPRRK